MTIITVIAATIVIQISGDSDYQPYTNKLVVNDVTRLNPIRVAKVVQPTSLKEISSAIINSKGPISIGGGRYSQGGQTAYQDSLHIDMRAFNKVLNLDKDNKQLSVQAGITWRDIQEHIDPHNFSVKIMQTYANFTVGGSLSVNVHGRYIGEGPLVHSVKSIKLVLADGKIVTASRNENQELFFAAIGGYGGIGVIAEATLSLADNTKIERSTTVMPIGEYHEHFFSNVRDNNKVVFHNGDIYPPKYEKVRDVTWHISDN
ncbi:MAG: FAD-dependent oxidoreductase, partial [Gammaproteobacteria bacterium]|nr:FAD-dependent oxidoreductase [Gammaproteobacteria bacterium]